MFIHFEGYSIIYLFYNLDRKSELSVYVISRNCKITPLKKHVSLTLKTAENTLMRCFVSPKLGPET